MNGAHNGREPRAESREPRAESREPRAKKLTPREAEVLALLRHGFTDAEMADRLTLSVRTVNNHVAHVLAKLGARNRATAIARATAANGVRAELVEE